jgi:hypothetical protein
VRALEGARGGRRIAQLVGQHAPELEGGQGRARIAGEPGDDRGERRNRSAGRPARRATSAAAKSDGTDAGSGALGGAIGARATRRCELPRRAAAGT